MKKRRKYFENRSLPKILLVISVAAIAFAGFQFMVGNTYGAMFFGVIGAFLLFLRSEIQLSDKQIDAIMQASKDEFAEEHIKGKVIGKQELNPKDFNIFSGYIRDGEDVRFKSCRDGKMRTSKYYVTAITANKNECTVISAVYDLFSEQSPEDAMIYTRGTKDIRFDKKETEFPKGNYECNLSVTQGSTENEQRFYLPTGDFLVDQLIESIEAL